MREELHSETDHLFPLGALAALLLVAILAGAGCSFQSSRAAQPSQPDEELAPLLENIGDLHFAVSTGSGEAQEFIDQALTLYYAFNHLESERSFRTAARLDPDCAMAYWGQALALGPNINDPSPDAEREANAYKAVAKALDLSAGATAKERAMIEALTMRYSGDEDRDRDALNVAYAARMTKLAKRYRNDPDIQVLYAAALMNTTPWDYWLEGGAQPKPEIAKSLAALERVMRDAPNHPGAHHFYIHAVEASSDPDRAVASADKLGGLVPVAGHLVHMPSHIYIRVGRYADAAQANRDAIVADEDYITQCRAQGIYPVAYYPHNIHFLWAALTMEGKGEEAIDAARKVAHQHNHEQMNEPGFGFPHLLKSLPYFALMRFGQWDELVAEPEPAEEMLFVRATRHFARGMAFRARGDQEAAATELAALEELAARPELAELTVWEMNSLATLAQIGAKTLRGELAAMHGSFDEAEKQIREAIAIEEELLYSEPPDWPQPARHSLGAVLLAAGKPVEAEQVYREDLERHRNNGWALTGLIESLDAQGRRDEAGEARERLAEVWIEADTAPERSRF